MARNTLKLVVPVIAAAGLLTAAEFWESKPASEWSEKDVRRIMTRSPWAKEVSAQFDASRMNRGGAGGPGAGGGGMGRSGGSGMPRGGGAGGMGAGGGMGGPGGGMAGGGGMGGGAGMGGPGGGMEGGAPGGGGGGFEAPRATVRWLSSSPMQQAALRNDGMKELAEWSKEFYVVAVSGMRMGMGGAGQGGPGAGGEGGGGRRQPRPEGEGQQPRAGAQGGPGGDAQQRTAQMRERMKEGTTLQIGTRGPMQPARIEMVRGESGPVTIFLFPRVSDVSLADKEIQFATAMGPMVVKTRFALKDMSVKGKVEL